MPIGDICQRDVVFVERDMPLIDAAQLMRTHHVGALVVVDDEKGKRMPIGMLTDRDIVVAVVAAQVDAQTLNVGDVMMDHLISAKETEGVWETIQHMRSAGVRRVPVVQKDGALVGIVAIDDLLGLLAAEMNDLAQVIAKEQTHERRLRV